MGAPVLGIVPARAGSKGIPGKNVRLLAGQPLLEYAARAARASGVCDRVVLSTDSEEIAAVGRRVGLDVPFLRPAALACDDTPMVDVIEHALAALEQDGWSPEIVVVLQPTSPLRRPERIAEAVSLLRSTGADSVVSVVQVPPHFSPDYAMKVVEGKLSPFAPEGARITRRQDARAAFARDGTVYAFWTRTLREGHDIYGRDCRPLVIAPSESVTLDSPEDWQAAERVLMAREPR